MKLLLLAAATLAMAWCRTPPAFDVASVKPNLSGGDNTQISLPGGGRFTATNASLKTLIRNAFGITPFQLSGGPAWLDADRYDIVATTASPGNLTQAQLKPLLQSLLAERFHLIFHRETRELPVYALTPAKHGPKLKKSAGQSGPSCNTKKSAAYAVMTCTGVTIAEFLKNLSPLDRIVIDKTGLTGTFDLTLSWSPDQTIESASPSVFTAMQDQLGLKLEAQRGPVEVIVIDRAEKASEN